nr:hypothetical protein [Mycoplasmopsis bovis]
MVLVILLQILSHKIKIIQKQEEPNGSGNSSSDTNPQIQDISKPPEDNIKEKKKWWP